MPQMATDNPVVPFGAAEKSPPFDRIVFFVFLLLVFVGLRPFSPPPPEVGAFGAQGMTGSGDVIRQVCYLAAFAVIAFEAVRLRGMQAVFDVPPLLVLLLAWCLTSALWAAEPGIAMRRAGLATVVVFSAMMSARSASAAEAMKNWRFVLLAVLLVCIVSVYVIPEAVHRPGEADANLVGDWRGLYGHKNIAGAVGAIAALLFVFAPRHAPYWPRKAADLAVAALALWFVAGTHSKSSFGLFFAALAFGLVYRLAWRRGIDRTIAVVAGLAVLVVAAAVLIADRTTIERIFSNPEEFTGRTEIWKAEIAYILDHPLLGAGFGSFADTGGASPLSGYAASWVGTVSHGHNGYLQILMTLGGVGFLIAVAGLIAQPVIFFWRRDGDDAVKPALFALFVFLLLHNFMESDFLEGDGTTWVAFVLMLAVLYDPMRKRAP
jgi:exopolysaccharide production protein ExoQ